MRAVRIPQRTVEILRADTRDADVVLPPEFSEDALALRFTELHPDWRYTAAWGRWSHWDGKAWQSDNVLRAFDLVRQICRAEAAKCDNKRVAAKITSAATVAAVERLARSDRRHAAIVEQWDADDWILNTPSGIVDLRTGRLESADHLKYCTKIAAVGPSSDESPHWNAFLKRITDGDEHLQAFMQRMCGYSLTGNTREHALFFLYGTGANGKSVFVSTISGILADYAKTAPIETFTASATEQHPTDVAGLHGARLVTAVETEEGRRWNESKLKSLTGGDRMAARYMRQDFFEFGPGSIRGRAGNHKPALRTVDESARRRINLLPFTVTIPNEERDPQLAEKLKAEWSAILGWMVGGCLAWQREGLHAPQVVRDATDEYLEAEDAIGRWIDDCCVLLPSRWASTDSLYRSWAAWCDLNQEHSCSKRKFSDRLDSRKELHRERGSDTEGTRGFQGITLR